MAEYVPQPKADRTAFVLKVTTVKTVSYLEAIAILIHVKASHNAQ